MDDIHSIYLGEDFRSAARSAVAEPLSVSECAAVWNSLLAGQNQIVAEFCSEKRGFLVLRSVTNQSSNRPTARSLQILERVLTGEVQKVVSVELGVSSSTVATTLKQVLEGLGLQCVPSKVPLLLVIIANAARGKGSLEASLVAHLQYSGLEYLVLSAPIPEQRLTTVLSPAETEVIRLRLEGRSHAEIAAKRRTSRRTVANQLATASQRLGISGRSALMELLIR